MKRLRAWCVALAPGAALAAAWLAAPGMLWLFWLGAELMICGALSLTAWST